MMTEGGRAAMCRQRARFGASVLGAASLVAGLSLQLSLAPLLAGQLGSVLAVAAAHARDGGSDGGGGHGGDDGGGSDRGGDDRGGGDRGGDDRDGDDHGGRGRGRDDGKGADDGAPEGRRGKERNVVEDFLQSLQGRGRVVWSTSRGGTVEVRYADGWGESVDGAVYRLLDPRRRVVVTRPARGSDLERLRAVAR